MNRPEQEIQKLLFKHIRSRAMPGVFAFHCPNGGKRSKIEASIFKGLGVKAGIPDVLIFYRAQIFGLELKAGNGRVSPAQLATMNDMEVAGARVAVACSLDEALITLEYWGVLRRDRNHYGSKGETHV